MLNAFQHLCKLYLLGEDYPYSSSRQTTNTLQEGEEVEKKRPQCVDLMHFTVEMK